jgi:hypothetical protein
METLAQFTKEQFRLSWDNSLSKIQVISSVKKQYWYSLKRNNSGYVGRVHREKIRIILG